MLLLLLELLVVLSLIGSIFCNYIERLDDDEVDLE